MEDYIPEVAAGGDEVLPPQKEETINESTEPIAQETQAETHDQDEAPRAPNTRPSPKQSWKELRTQKEQAERERDEALRILRDIELQRQASQHAVPQEDDEIRLAPDELAEGKHLSKVDRKIKKLEEQIQQYHQKTAELTAEARLKAQYPDFDKVVSADNVKTLREEFPELAETLNANNNLYSKAVAAYTMIKKMGIHVEDVFQSERQQVQKNIAKPKVIASLSPQQGDSPLSKANAFANGLTPELQAALRKEMDEARRNL